jgi:hypothetical protein
LARFSGLSWSRLPASDDPLRWSDRLAPAVENVKGCRPLETDLRAAFFLNRTALPPDKEDMDTMLKQHGPAPFLISQPQASVFA